MYNTKKKYYVEWVYACDSNDLYREIVELTDDERDRVVSFLDKMYKAGRIGLTSAGNCFVSPYRDPEAANFDSLRAAWANSFMGEMGEDEGIGL